MTPPGDARAGAVRPPRPAGRGATAAALLLPLLAACSSPPVAATGTGGAHPPELVLRGVTVRHTAVDGRLERLEATRGTYTLAGKTISAEGVTVHVPSPRGEALVQAPAAEWGTERGRLLLPSGGTALLGGAYRVTLERGEVDLSARVLHGEGAATLEGPGFSVTGSALTWDLRSGTGGLSSPRARIFPSVLAKKG